MWQLSIQIIFLTLLAASHACAQDQGANAQVLSVLTADTQIAGKTLPKAFVLDGAIDEWFASESSADLSSSAARAPTCGQLWIAQSDTGILVAGLLNAEPPQKCIDSAKTNDISLELAVASMKNLTLPPISWGFRTPEPGYSAARRIAAP